MEIRARYVLMGLFLLAAIAGVFGFVYWLENSAGFREQTVYRIRFDSPVAGLLTGSAVLFNGIRVGEVTALRIRADKPNEVYVDVSVVASTPVRTDTVVDLDYQGLTGVAAILLTGGKDGAPIIALGGEPPVLDAKKGAGVTISQSARDALVKLNGILDSNAKPLSELIGNLNEFASALSRNSGKVDGILAGLERMTGGPKGPDNDKVFDIAAPKTFPSAPKQLHGQLIVALPSAIFELDTQNIIFRPAEGQAPLPAGPRWADNLTRLVQARVTQSFENAGYGANVSQSPDVTGDFRLLIDIRTFQMVVSPEPKAEVALSAKVTDASGKIIAAKVFSTAKPAQSAETGPAIAALNAAFQSVTSDLIVWSADAIVNVPEPSPAPTPQALDEPAKQEPAKQDPAQVATPAVQ
jgi:phospholipid/cholesterol/gamma-HCH transport system substrate-binding protein